MPRISLPPFLKKLQAVCSGVEESIAHWSEDGGTFIVESSDAFEKELSKFYKGSLLTFIRQLHFYGFRKVDIKGEKWSFSHKCFKKDLPHLIYEIRRKTRTETNDGVASQLEVQALRDHVGKLHEMFTSLQKEFTKTKEELTALKASVKRDSMRAFSNDFSMESISNGGDLVSSKKQKLSSSGDIVSKTKSFDEDSVSNLKLAPFDDLASLGSYSDADNFGCFLPFTDSTYESMTTSMK